MAAKPLLLLALAPSSSLDPMERTLAGVGYDLSIANDKVELDEYMQVSSPDLVILNVNFAGEDGFQIARSLLDRFPTLPIILYTNKHTAEIANSALKTGVSGYIYPPMAMGDVVEEVQKSLSRARKLGDWLRGEVRRTTSSLQEKAKISEAEKSRLEAIIANIQDGVIVIDDRNVILFVNQAVRDIFNMQLDSLVGKRLKDAIDNAELHALLDRAESGSLKYHEINFDDGRVFNAQYAPIPRIGAAVTMQEISYLKELDRLKNDFIDTISHDLRSPLTAIMGYTELLERTSPLNETQIDFLHRLQGSVDHVRNLVNELLDLGRLDAGFDTRREYVQLKDVLHFSLKMFEEQIKEKNLQLITDISDNMQEIRVNPIRIRQMLDNLVGNAIKYTPQNGSVKIHMSIQNDQVIFKVEDTGPGIQPEEQGKVFDKFYRASTVPDYVEGTGLGLAIVKSIVDSHQGRVWVDSVVGSGSTFTVLLPTHE